MRKGKCDRVRVSLGCVVRSLCGRISDNTRRSLNATIILKEVRMRIPEGNEIGRSPQGMLGVILSTDSPADSPFVHFSVWPSWVIIFFKVWISKCTAFFSIKFRVPWYHGVVVFPEQHTIYCSNVSKVTIFRSRHILPDQ